MMRKLMALAPLALLAAACDNPLDNGDDVGGHGGSNFGGGPGEPVAGGSGGGGSEATELGYVAGNVPDGDECVAQLTTTRGRLVHSSVGGLASVQYTKAALAAGRFPDPKALRVDDFESYFTDRIPPLDPPEAGAKVTVVSRVRQDETEGAKKGQLDVRTTWRAQETLPLDLVVVLDVSSSTEDVIHVRDAFLQSLAQSVQDAQDHTLTVITYGDEPETVLDHARGEGLLEDLQTAIGQLSIKPGNNLVAALAEAAEVVNKAKSTAHVLLVTDGGVIWHPDIQSAVIDIGLQGGVTSIAQLGRPSETDGVAPYFNDPLLEGVARTGLGTRLYISGAAGELATIRARYRELFAVVSPTAWVDLVLPAGFQPVQSDGAPFVPLESVPTRPMALSPFSSNLLIESLCGAPFDDATATLEVEVHDGSTLIGSGKTTLVTQDEQRRLVNQQLQLVVEGLRNRNPGELHDARLALELEAPGDCTVSGAEDACVNSRAPLCCVLQQVAALIDDSCAVFEGDAKSICMTGEAPGL